MRLTVSVFIAILVGLLLVSSPAMAGWIYLYSVYNSAKTDSKSTVSTIRKDKFEQNYYHRHLYRPNNYLSQKDWANCFLGTQTDDRHPHVMDQTKPSTQVPNSAS